MNQFFETVSQELYNYYEQIAEIVPKLLVAILVVLVIRWVANRVSKKLVSYLNTKASDPLLSKFLGRIFKLVMLVLGIVLFLNILGWGTIATGLMGTAGVGAFIIGFAFKDIGEHFLAGFILAFNRPFNIGDLVELDGQKGKVLSLNIRDTQLKTFDGRDLFIPNGNIIKRTLVNYTCDGFMRQHVTLGLDYGTDLNKALQIIVDTMNNIDGILQEDKKPSVGIDHLGTSSIRLNVYYWLDTFDKSINSNKIKIDIVHQLITKLEKAGCYLPGDIIEVKNYKNTNLLSPDGSSSN